MLNYELPTSLYVQLEKNPNKWFVMPSIDEKQLKQFYRLTKTNYLMDSDGTGYGNTYLLETRHIDTRFNNDIVLVQLWESNLVLAHACSMGYSCWKGNLFIDDSLVKMLKSKISNAIKNIILNTNSDYKSPFLNFEKLIDAIPPEILIDNKAIFDELFQNTIKENIETFTSNPNGRSLYENKLANQLGINIIKYYHESLVTKEKEMIKQNTKRKAFLKKLSSPQEYTHNSSIVDSREDD